MTHKLQEMIDGLVRRDKAMIDDMSGFMGGGMSIENRIALADGRGFDAMSAAILLAKYIMEREAETKGQT